MWFNFLCFSRFAPSSIYGLFLACPHFSGPFIHVRSMCFLGCCSTLVGGLVDLSPSMHPWPYPRPLPPLFKTDYSSWIISTHCFKACPCHFFINHLHFDLCAYCFTEVLLLMESESHFLIKSESFLIVQTYWSLVSRATSLLSGMSPSCLWHTTLLFYHLGCLLFPNTGYAQNLVLGHLFVFP